MTMVSSGLIALAGTGTSGGFNQSVEVELGGSGSSIITMNDSNVRGLAGVASGAISMSNMYGKAYTVAGNSGILTSGTSYTLPSTSGLTVKILVIAGGAGGGGGSGRTAYSGYYTAGGGGGAGGNSYAQVSVTPGQTITFSIGSGGTAGTTRDGIYSSGSNGGVGGNSSASVSGSVVCSAASGGGGLVSPNASGGTYGTSVVGTTLLGASQGNTAGAGTTYGGGGAPGYFINTTVGATTILTYGAAGVTYPEGTTSTYNTPGTGYGAGGSGGSCAQSDVYVPSYNIYANPGNGGAVFIWWGY